MGEAGLCTAGEGFLAFGDNLYRMPERMPGVKGLKVLRPGLHLGTLKRIVSNRLMRWHWRCARRM